jgi:hypothetical protein
VQQYLKEHRLGTNPDPNSDATNSTVDKYRQTQFERFSIYLISTCYRKTRRRLSKGLSKKLLYLLSSIKGPQLEKFMKTSNFTPSPAAGNLRLCQVVFSEQKVIDLQGKVQALKDKDSDPPSAKGTKAMEQELKNDPPPAKGTDLFQAISTAFTSHQQSSQQSSQQSNHPLYTEKTLVDFHYLLVIVLRQYENTINQFHNMKDSRTEVQLNLNVYSQLLWSLSTSPILRTHLLFITQLMNQGLMRGGMDPKAKDGEDTGGGSYDDDDDEDAEMEAIEKCKHHKVDSGLMVQCWISLLVSPLQALKILSRFSCLHHGEVEIRHVSVKSTRFDTLQDWTRVLERTLRDTVLATPLDELERLIIEKIREVKASGPGCKGIYHYFEGKNIVNVGGQVHCEAGLAAWLKSNLQDNGEHNLVRFDEQITFLFSI